MNLTRWHLFVLVLPLLILSIGCSKRDPSSLEIARAKIDPLVFDDDYGEDVYFQAFFRTHLTAIEVDSVYAYNGYAPDGAEAVTLAKKLMRQK